MLFIRMDTAGNLSYLKTIKGTAADEATKISAQSDGFVYALGTSWSDGLTK